MTSAGAPDDRPAAETVLSQASPDGARPRKIALVVVHGVGAQQPGGPVRAVGDLLLGALGADSGPDGSLRGLRERAVRVPLHPVEVATDGANRPGKPGFFARLFSFDERSRYARRQLRARSPRRVRAARARAAEGQEPEPPPPSGDMGYQFMRAQLAGYRRDAAGVPELAYETACLEGTVHGRDGAPIVELHLHEMFWADLGRIGSGVLSVFGHLYQLLFHLPSLGRNTADFAAIENAGVAGWWTFMRLRNGAGRILTLPIPILNLVLVMASLVALSGSVPGSRLVAMALAGLMALGLTFGALWARPPATTRAWWLVPIVTGIALGAAGLWGASPRPYHALAIECWLLSGAAVAWVLAQFAKVRPGALGAGLVLLLLSSVWFGIESAAAPDSALGTATVGLHVLQAAIWVLGICWLALAVCFALTLLASAFAIAGTPKGSPARRRARHAVWTAHATLGLSSALVLILNLSLWSAVFNVAGRFLPAGCIAPLAWDRCQLDSILCTSELARQMLLCRAGWGLLAALVCFGLLLLAAGWGLFPSVLAEVRPPRTSNPERARRFGAWLCRAFPVIAGAALLLGVVLAIGIMVDLWRPLNEDSKGFMERLLWISGAAIVALVGAKAWLSAIGTVVGVMLEVDNYMREHPRDSAPRARIAERFVSLLRHLGSAGAPGEGGYDALVIVAHSQGTVIAADLLRFLEVQRRCDGGTECDPELAWLHDRPLYLFTMGCPLRQLYGWCFPHLYEWVEPSTPWLGPTPEDASIPAETGPDPRELGSQVRWLNAYRTGDYVGRSLWLADDAACAWMRNHPCAPDSSLPTVFTDGHRRMEACIGEGAHTHYWDATAPEVARLLQRLLGEVAGQLR
jgi:hypothetical protein